VHYGRVGLSRDGGRLVAVGSDGIAIVDVAPLSAERFELGAARPEFNVV
jgi:hypothetical protein